MYNPDNNEGERSANEKMVLNYEEPLELRPELRVASSPSARLLVTGRVKTPPNEKRWSDLRFVKDTSNSEHQRG